MLTKLITTLQAKLMPEAGGHMKKIGANMIWLLLDKFLRYGLALVVGFWLARSIGKEGFGILNNAIAFVTLFTALYTLGIDSIVVKELTHHPEKRAELLGTSFMMRMLGSLLTAAICLVYHYIHSDPLFFKIIAITTLMPILQTFEVPDFYFQSVTKSKMTVFGKFAGLVAVITLRIVFIVTDAPLIWFAVANVAEFAAGAVAIIYIYQKNIGDLFHWTYNRDLAKKIIRESWPLAVSMLGSFIYFNMGMIQIGEIAGEAEAGIYAAGIRFSVFWYFIPSLIFVSVYPHLLALKKESNEYFSKRLLQIHVSMVWGYILLGACIYIFAPQLIHYTFGDGYAGAAEILRAHIWSGVFIFLASSAQIWYLAHHKTQFVILNNIVGAVVNIVLNYIFIHRYGAIGACYSCVISYFCGHVLATAIFPATRPLFKDLLRAFNPLELRRVLGN